MPAITRSMYRTTITINSETMEQRGTCKLDGVQVTRMGLKNVLKARDIALLLGVSVSTVKNWWNGVYAGKGENRIMVTPPCLTFHIMNNRQCTRYSTMHDINQMQRKMYGKAAGI